MSVNQPPSRPPSAPAGVATITDQQPTFDSGPTGQVVRGTRVFFLTTTGQQGSVFVPESMYTEDNVKAAVAAKAGPMVRLHGAQV